MTVAPPADASPIATSPGCCCQRVTRFPLHTSAGSRQPRPCSGWSSTRPARSSTSGPRLASFPRGCAAQSWRHTTPAPTTTVRYPRSGRRWTMSARGPRTIALGWRTWFPPATTTTATGPDSRTGTQPTKRPTAAGVSRADAEADAKAHRRCFAPAVAKLQPRALQPRAVAPSRAIIRVPSPRAESGPAEDLATWTRRPRPRSRTHAADAAPAGSCRDGMRSLHILHWTHR